jgi:hypothetical protein
MADGPGHRLDVRAHRAEDDDRVGVSGTLVSRPRASPAGHWEPRQ